MKGIRRKKEETLSELIESLRPIQGEYKSLDVVIDDIYLILKEIAKEVSELEEGGIHK